MYFFVCVCVCVSVCVYLCVCVYVLPSTALEASPPLEVED
jgi:hypothetical protein